MRATAHAGEGATGGVAELAEVFGAEIGQFMVFAVTPDVFGGIEFGRVGRQVFHVDAAALAGDKLAYGTAAMHRQAIPDDRQLAADVTLEVLQKLDDLRGFDAAGKEPKVKVPDRDPGHGRETFPIERVLQHRSLTPWCPGAHPMRSLAQPALVHEDYGSLLLEGFFLMSGQRTRFHRSDRRLIPLTSAPHGSLATPAQRSQDPPHMPGVKRVPVCRWIKSATRHVVHSPLP